MSFFTRFVFLLILGVSLHSCGPKIGNKLSAKESESAKFYQTWDGKIHQSNSVKTGMYKWIFFDDQKVLYDDIKAYQDNKGYYINRWGPVSEITEKTAAIKKVRAAQSMSPMFFAERLVKGKINIYFAITYWDKEAGSRGDYFFQKNNADAVFPLRTFTLKDAIGDCTNCKSLLEDAISTYENLPKWRRRAADAYIASEKKLVNSLVAVISEYNTH